MESLSKTVGTSPQCTECIAATHGCCVTPFEEGWKIVVLPDEIAAIAALTGREPSTFVDETALVPDQREYYLEGETTDPLWASLFARWPSPTGFKGACPFLSRHGCTLPYGSKPFLCQAYPIDFNLTHQTLALTTVEEDDRCDVTAAARSPRDVTDCFGDDLASLHERLGLFRQRVLKLLEQLEGSRADARASAGTG